MGRMRISLLVGLLLLLGSVAFPGEPKPPTTDWPCWRGPNADGVADGRNLPLRWSQTENILWSAKLPGWGTSSPVVYGNRVFVTSQLQEQGKKALLTTNKLGERITASPAMSGNELIYRTDSHLYCTGQAGGK